MGRITHDEPDRRRGITDQHSLAGADDQRSITRSLVAPVQCNVSYAPGRAAGYRLRFLFKRRVIFQAANERLKAVRNNHDLVVTFLIDVNDPRLTCGTAFAVVEAD